MANIALILAYDGTGYIGWQDSKTGTSIEGTLQTVLEKILQQPVKLQATSRTDAGVHAHGQVVNFHTETAISDLNQLAHSLNCLLPPMIRVIKSWEAPEDFHPTLDAQSKTYVYELCWGAVQHPRQCKYSWHYPRALDVEAMREASELLLGVHNFEAFSNQKCNESYASHIRELWEISITEVDLKRLRFTIRGRSFLYKMVRNIVGTLAYVGSGKMTAEDVKRALEGRQRTKAGVTAPAHGLTLDSIALGHLGPS